MLLFLHPFARPFADGANNQNLRDHLIYAGAGKVTFLLRCPRIGAVPRKMIYRCGLVLVGIVWSRKSGLAYSVLSSSFTFFRPPVYLSSLEYEVQSEREPSAKPSELFSAGYESPSARDDQVVRRFNGASASSPLHVRSPPGGWGLYAGRDISKPLREACVRHSSSLDEATSISNFFFLLPCFITPLCSNRFRLSQCPQVPLDHPDYPCRPVISQKFFGSHARWRAFHWVQQQFVDEGGTQSCPAMSLSLLLRVCLYAGTAVLLLVWKGP